MFWSPLNFDCKNIFFKVWVGFIREISKLPFEIQRKFYGLPYLIAPKNFWKDPLILLEWKNDDKNSDKNNNNDGNHE